MNTPWVSIPWSLRIFNLFLAISTLLFSKIVSKISEYLSSRNSSTFCYSRLWTSKYSISAMKYYFNQRNEPTWLVERWFKHLSTVAPFTQSEFLFSIASEKTNRLNPCACLYIILFFISNLHIFLWNLIYIMFCKSK